MLFATIFTWRVCCLNDLSSCLRTVDSPSTQVAHPKRFGRYSVPFFLLRYPVEITQTGGPLELGTLFCIYSGAQESRLDLVTAHCSNGSE